jgi:probable HAF family extracellular repeat protein
MGINSAGDVVGYSKGAAGMRAFLWTKTGGMQDLGVLEGGNSSRAFNVNASRAVVGTSTSAAGDRAFVWKPQVGMKDLNEAIPADQRLVLVEAHLINNRGQIVVMGTRMEDSTDHVPTVADADVCAPAPATVYLLTPSE